MSNLTPDSVTCRITGVVHKIVCIGQNEDVFSAYLQNLLARLNSREKINIAIDCEGWVLGIKKNSLGLIQMAECFDRNILRQKPTDKVSINLKPGFMIRTPIRIEIIDLLSKVFTHKNITLITFDFTADITSMMEVGIKFNLANVVDGQTTYSCKGEKNFSNTRSIGLKTACKKADNCVEFEAAQGAINEKKDVDFDELYCKAKNEKDPFSQMLDDKFWMYSSSDIALTAIALVGQLKQFEPLKIKNATRSKAKSFLLTQKKCGLHAPSLIRQFAFIGRKSIMNEISTAKEAYKVISKVDIILENYDSYLKLVQKKDQIPREDLIKAVQNAYAIISA